MESSLLAMEKRVILTIGLSRTPGALPGVSKDSSDLYVAITIAALLLRLASPSSKMFYKHNKLY
jgi:hypothetical protein